MSDEETAHPCSKMGLQSRRKRVRDLTGGNTLVSRVAKQQGVTALGRVKDETYRVGLERAVFQVGPNIKLSTTFHFAEPIYSEHNELLELESVRVKTVAVFLVPRLICKKILHVSDTETNL